DARRGKLARPGLDPGCAVHRLHAGDRWHAGIVAPGQKFLRRPRIGAARVRIADVGREEFEKAHRRALAGGGDEGRQRGRADRDELVHAHSFGAGEQPSMSYSSKTLLLTAEGGPLNHPSASASARLSVRRNSGRLPPTSTWSSRMAPIVRMPVSV